MPEHPPNEPAEAPGEREKPSLIDIAVDWEGRITWNGEPITHEELYARLAARRRRPPAG